MISIQAELLYEYELPAEKDSAPILEYRDRALYNACLDMDGAGNLIDGFSHIQGNATAYHFLRTDHATGQMTPLAEVLPPAGFKIDSAAWCQSGPNLIVGMTAHEAISEPTRRVWYARAVVPNVVVPRSDGRGLFIDPALLGGGEPPPAPQPGVTVDEIVTAIKADMAGELGDLIQKRAKNGARQAVQLEVTEANGVLRDVPTPAYLRTPDALLAVLKDGLYLWMQERIYETVAKFLDPKPGQKGDN